MSSNTTLLKFLTEAGLGSRRKLADAIRQGRVQVNGIVAEDFRHPINLAKDSVTFDGQPVSPARPQTICLMLNKPAGVITTTSDERGRKTVLDILPEKFRCWRLYPVGRLDRDSTGLLLLTNDGNLTYRLTHPKFEHEKEYLVAISGTLKPRQKQKLEKGIELSDGKTYPARVKTVRNMTPFNYSITIHEGRKRQVHRMFEELGYRTLALRRVRIGNLRLGDLKEGEVRELSPDAVEESLKQRTQVLSQS
jgi:23S rRNA pseudouridine2605 synthase